MRGDHLAVILPGRGYGPQGPVLHLPRLILEQVGATVAVIEYPLDDGALPEDGQWDRFHESVHAQVDALLAEYHPHRLTFVAKSLGTIALAGLDVERHLGDLVEAVWLTPLWGRDEVRHGALHLAIRSLVVAGGADPMHHAERHDEVCHTIEAASLIIPDADHSLEIPGDVNRTLVAYGALTGAVERFIGWHPA